MKFNYPCPSCRAKNNLHDPDCDFNGVSINKIESVYIDLLSYLTTGTYTRTDIERGIGQENWTDIHTEAISYLKNTRRVTEKSDGKLSLLDAETYKEEVSQPRHDPMKTLYEEGSVPGAHDNTVFAMIAYYEMVGLSWEETQEKMLSWLEETGTWDRGGFAEDTPEELVEAKKHVHEEGYGWKEKANAAKRIIDRELSG